MNAIEALSTFLHFQALVNQAVDLMREAADVCDAGGLPIPGSLTKAIETLDDAFSDLA